MTDTLALPAAPAPGKPRTLMLGVLLALTAGSVFFGTLLGVYTLMRDSSGGTTPGWVPDGTEFRNAQLVMTVFTLLVSCVFMWWAVHANRRRDAGNARIAVLVTFLFGLLHLNMLLFSVDALGPGLGSVWSNLVYPITAASALLTAFAMAILFAMTLRLFGGQVGDRNPGLEPVAALWYFQTAVWSLVFIAIYAVK